MDETVPTIVWPAIPVVLALAVAGTVFILQKLKMLICTHFKGQWTQKIPGWVWLVLSIILPFGLVYLLCQPFSYSWLNQFLPEDMQLSIPPEALFPTALGAIFGSGGSYSVAKKLGLAADYSAGGPLDVTPQPVPEAGDESTAPAEENSEAEVQPSLPSPAPAPEAVAPSADLGLANSETKVTMFLKLTGVSDATYVMIEDQTGQHVYPVSTD